MTQRVSSRHIVLGVAFVAFIVGTTSGRPCESGDKPANLGVNCGQDPSSILLYPPNIWRYPNCEDWYLMGEIPCQSNPYHNGWFDHRALGGEIVATGSCCSSSHSGCIRYSYDKDGNETGWWIYCASNS